MSSLSLSRSERSVPRISLPHLGFGMLFVLALVLRGALYHIITPDYTAFVSRWYDFIQSHGGFAAMQYNFSNYNPPYLYLIALTTYLPIPKLIALKSISVVFDLVLALFTYLILRLKYARSYLPLVGATAMLFTPTVFINSAAWGQCDAIYASFCLGSLYFLLKRRWGWACVFFGLAIAFKLQAIFFLPVLLLLALKRALPVRYLALIPAVFLLLLAPAFLAGRDVRSLLSVYVEQTTTGGVGGGTQPFQTGGASAGASGMPRFGTGNGQPFNGAGGRPSAPANGFRQGARGGFGGRNSFASLTYNAPTIYQWFTGTALANNKWVGIALAALAVALVGGLLLASKTGLTSNLVLHISLVCVLAIPFLLPDMHERYFFLADVVSIVFAFYFPRAFYIPIVMQLASLLSYAPYLVHAEPVSLAYVSFAVLGITLVAAAKFVRRCDLSALRGYLP